MHTNILKAHRRLNKRKLVRKVERSISGKAELLVLKKKVHGGSSKITSISWREGENAQSDLGLHAWIQEYIHSTSG